MVWTTKELPSINSSYRFNLVSEITALIRYMYALLDADTWVSDY